VPTERKGDKVGERERERDRERETEREREREREREIGATKTHKKQVQHLSYS
jgi:hypothetical protein